MDKSKDKSKRAEEIAVQILKYSRNELLVSLRFMDLALCKLEYKMENLKSIATDGKYLYYLISYFGGAIAACVLTYIVGKARHYE